MNTDWIPASGQGRVYSWVVATHPVAPLLADQVPYVIALVDLDEGVRVVANIEGCEPRDIAAGMEVDLHFEDLDDEVTIPNFRIRQSDQLEK